MKKESLWILYAPTVFSDVIQTSTVRRMSAKLRVDKQVSKQHKKDNLKRTEVMLKKSDAFPTFKKRRNTKGRLQTKNTVLQKISASDMRAECNI